MKALYLALISLTILSLCACKPTAQVTVQITPKEQLPSSKEFLNSIYESSEHEHGPYDWTKPKSWLKEENSDPMRLAAFRIQSNTEQANCTIVSLPENAGSILANVNRWRAQVALPKITDQELRYEEINLRIGKAAVLRIEGQKTSIVAAIIKKEDHTLFIKMMGPNNIIDSQRSTFKTFIKSLRPHEH